MQPLDIKLSIPHIPPSFVSRQRLFDRLDESLQKPLTLISAPAGSGKTTLLGQWIQKRQRRVQVAWVSLGLEENDPYRFWQYAVAAIKRMANSVMSAGFQNPAGPTMDDLESLIDWIISYIQSDFMLVFDDYHVIASPEIHHALAYLLDIIPLNMHIMIACRALPPLPIAQMRVRSLLVEFNKDDLKFSHDEATAFLNSKGLKKMVFNEVERLNTRVEGWAAGLQVAALVLRDSDEITSQRLLEHFSGTHYFLDEYFLEQVFCLQPGEVQEFLLSTSILESFNKSLCQAVTGITESGKILRCLEHGNLFLIRLDVGGEWYRYHQLFADFLRNKLRHDHADLYAMLHKRAAEWYEGQGQFEMAVEHALDAGEIDLADRLIQQVEERMWGRYKIKTLGYWFDALPTEFVKSRPDLCLSMAWRIALSDNLDGLPHYLGRIEDYCMKFRPESKQPDGSSNSVAGVSTWRYSTDYYQAHIDILRGYHAMLQGKLQEAFPFLKHAIDLSPNDNYCRERALALHYMGLYFFWNYNLADAAEKFTAAAHVGRNCGHHFIHVASLSNLASIQVILGNLSYAEGYYEQIVQYIANIESDLRVTGNHFGVNDIRLMRNQLVITAKDSDAYFRFSEESDSTFDLVSAYVGISKLKQAEGNLTEALACLRKALQTASQRRIYVLEQMVDLWMVRFELLSGNLSMAARWVDQLENNRMEIPYLNEIQNLTIARFFLADGRSDDAIQLLESLREKTQLGGRQGIVVEVMALLALAYQKKGYRDLARETLGELIIKTQPDKYIRVFVDEGDEMKTLLQETLRKNPRLLEDKAVKNYIDQVLKAFGKPDLGQARSAKLISKASDEARFNHQPLVEPLSERELQVLRLIAQGRSYEQVANELIVALSTIQWHVKNIYQKLNVHNGMEAVAAARGLGIML